MRLNTLAIAGALAATTAALAQVTTPETEQKVPTAGQSPLGNDMAAADSASPSASPATSSSPAASSSPTASSSPSSDAAANTDAPPASDGSPAAAPTEQKPGARRPRR